jgi:hypothetical protein
VGVLGGESCEDTRVAGDSFLLKLRNLLFLDLDDNLFLFSVHRSTFIFFSSYLFSNQRWDAESKKSLENTAFRLIVVSREFTAFSS